MANSTGFQIANNRRYKSATMSSAGGLTPAIFLGGYRVAGLNFSSGWDAANRMTFQVGDAGSATTPTYRDLYDQANNEMQIASGAIVSATGRAITLDTDLSLALSAHEYFKMRAGPGTASATPSTGVTITAVLVPF